MPRLTSDLPPLPVDAWAPLRRRWPLFAASTAGLVLHQVAEALVPVVIGIVIDRAIAPGDLGALVGWLSALAGLFVVLALSWRFGRSAGVRVAEAAGFELRGSLIRRVLDPRGMQRTRRPGELVAIAGGDVDRVVGVVWVIGGAVAKGAAVATVAVSLLLISLPLGVAVLVATPILLVGMHLVAGPLERRTDAEQESIAHAGAVAGDLLTGLRTLKGLGAEDAAVRRFAAANQESWRHARRAADLVGAYVGVSAALSGLFLAGLAWFAGGQAAAGSITIGELVAVLGLAQFLQWPMSGLAFVGAEMATARASAVRVAKVLQAAPVWDRLTGPPPPRWARTAPAARGHLRAGRPVPGTGDASLRCAPRVRSRPPNSSMCWPVGVPAAGGSMLIGGVEITGPGGGCDGARCRRSTAPRGDPGRHARRQCAAGLCARTTPGWRRRRPPPRSTTSSGMRTAAGRRSWANAASPCPAVSASGSPWPGRWPPMRPILVLHDPTSAVDSVTEFAIAAGVREFRGQGATLLVTSSPALLAVADRVLVLRDGQVTDTGTHHDLMARNERYRERVAG